MLTEQIILQNKGNYIRLGGRGIMDGLKQRKNKVSFLKIAGLRRPDVTADNQAMVVKQYRKKYERLLHRHNWNQDFEIITPKEFKQLPVY